MAKQAAKWHCTVVLPGERDPILWKRMDSWFNLAKSVPSDNSLPDTLSWQDITIEIEKLRGFIENSIKSPIVSCHNDLTAGNLIYDDDQGIFNIILLNIKLIKYI